MTTCGACMFTIQAGTNVLFPSGPFLIISSINDFTSDTSDLYIVSIWPKYRCMCQWWRNDSPCNVQVEFTADHATTDDLFDDVTVRKSIFVFFLGCFYSVFFYLFFIVFVYFMKTFSLFYFLSFFCVHYFVCTNHLWCTNFFCTFVV